MSHRTMLDSRHNWDYGRKFCLIRLFIRIHVSDTQAVSHGLSCKLYYYCDLYHVPAEKNSMFCLFSRSFSSFNLVVSIVLSQK